MPWSTWPITVTTGGRVSTFASSFAALSARNDSGSSTLAGFARWPISWTTIIAVSWSSTWLMVAIVPIFIIVLMTSAAFTDILCARSPTLMVSGTSTSSTLGSDGAANAVPPSSSRWRPPPPRERQPSRPPLASPRVLMARRRATSSTQAEAGFAARLGPFLSDFASFSPGLSTGRCKVPSGLAAAAASATTLASAFCSAFTSTSTGASASVAGSSPFLRMTRFFFGGSPSSGAAAGAGAAGALASSFFLVAAARLVRVSASAAWRAASSAWRFASASRLRASASSMIGAGGASAFTGSGATTSAGLSTFTKVRFLRTSTWIVRALPVASAFLISVVCLRVSVIFFFSSLLPCISRR